MKARFTAAVKGRTRLNVVFFFLFQNENEIHK